MLSHRLRRESLFMKRVWLLLGALLPWLAVFAVCNLAGCQSQSPFAAFGSATVPAPKTTQSAPYYPPNPTASTPTAETRVASPRLSVSAEDRSAIAIPRSKFLADPADREPIRIVDNPSAATRTATSTNRTAPATNSPAPMALPPAINTPAATTNRLPPPPSAGSQKGAMKFRTDTAVTPASYQQPAATFVETPAASSQWRAR
jgi:hypothetical protein